MWGWNFRNTRLKQEHREHESIEDFLKHGVITVCPARLNSDRIKYTRPKGLDVNADGLISFAAVYMELV